ncbi:MAG: SDR family oxidoreductase [Hahellaceae bacterium]|nr:SDR family oxidoreductase [Hahellaceae bacterium]MCP5169202.1 SDR family oxidoreductase [Hahellaceae bacterium]
MKSLYNKVVAITGAASGIGRALAEVCAAQGAFLALADVNEAGLHALAEDLRTKRAQVIVQRVDVSNAAEVEAWAAAVESHYGYVDVVVNNAGIALSQKADALGREQVERLFGINFWGVVNGTSAFVDALKKRPEALIVNISSVFGIIGVATQSAYNASKFAVRGYTEALRQDMSGTQVKVLCVHPGGVRTALVSNGIHEASIDGSASQNLPQLFERIALTTPEQAAAQIVRAMKRGSRRLLIGPDAILLDLMQRLLPGSYDRVLLPVAQIGMRLMRSA